MKPLDRWWVVQSAVHGEVFGPWPDIRQRISEWWSQIAPDEGLGSSDCNHIVYGWVMSGELTPVHGRFVVYRVTGDGDSLDRLQVAATCARLDFALDLRDALGGPFVVYDLGDVERGKLDWCDAEGLLLL